MTLGIVYHMPFWRDRDGRLRELEGSFARYVDSLAPYFDEISLCVPVIPAPDRDGTPIRSSNVTVAALPAFEGPLQFYPKLPVIVPRIFQWVRAIDVLHCRVPTPAAVFAFAAARLFRRPAFLLVVGDLRALLPSMPYRGVKRALWKAYTAFEERNVQSMADRALTFANGAELTAKHARPARPVIQTTTTTIREADIASRTDTCQAASIRAVTVSRIDPRKGLRVLPEVIASLTAKGIDVSLDVIGPEVGRPGAAERARIEADAARLGVSERLNFAGPLALERLLPKYAEYDLFVLPTLPGEGVPRVLLEAMSAGLPVVTSRVAGIPSLITHEANGLLVDRPDADSVAAAIARVIADRPLRQRLIANGYDTARAHTLEIQAARMMDTVAAGLHVALRQPATVPIA